MTRFSSMSGLKGFAAACVISAALGTAAQAAELTATCGTHQQLTAFLTSHYAEQVQALGLTGDGTLIELYVSPQATWSAVVTTPRGVACLVAAGTDWQTDQQTKVSPSMDAIFNEPQPNQHHNY